MKSNPRAPRPAGAAGQRGAAAPQRGSTAPRRATPQQTRAFVDGIISEMRRVTWPTRDQWIGATLLTIALVVMVGVFTSACDWIFAALFQLITGNAH
jgi:preprotein translocase SecE subunit